MPKNKTRHIFSILLCLILFFYTTIPSSAQISPTAYKNTDTTTQIKAEENIVRVGYVSVNGYEEGGEGEYKTGFGYEYFQKISYYTGWKYEYVYGSFSELITMLSKGEIDLLGNVTATDERAKSMNFSSYPEGSENFYIFVKEEREDLQSSNPDTLQGLKIGVGRNTYQSTLADEYFKQLGVSVQKVELEGTKGIVAAMEDGTIDAAVITDATDYGYIPVFHIGFHDYYFAVSQSRPDLLAELDTALYQIQSADPNYNASVAQKYSFGTVGIHYLTKQEKDWLTAHNNTIRIGYLEDNLPYSITNADGKLGGVLGIVVGQLEEKFGIRVETTAYPTVPESRFALTRGEVDCIGPLYGDYYLTEQFGKVQTNSVLNTTPVLLYKDTLKTDCIAVSSRSIFSAPVVQILYPNAEIVEYETIEDCMKAVKNKQADCTIITAAKINLLHRYSIMDELSYAELLQNAELCLFVNRGQSGLLTLLNKAISLSGTQLKGATFVTAADGTGSFSWSKFIREHTISLFLTSLLVILILSLLLFHIYLSEIRAKQAEAKANETHRKLQEERKAKDNLEKEFSVNPLTGLKNRRSFQRDSSELTDLRQIAVLSIDANGLKEVNDREGHEQGNELLRVVATLIEDVFGEVGQCYHLSGDEFAIIQNKKLDEIDTYVQRLKVRCVQVRNPHFQVSLSVGYAKGAEYPNLPMEQLFHYADNKMYQDKIAHYQNLVYDRRKNFASNGISRVATNLSEYVPGGYFAYEAQGSEEILYLNSEMLKLYECSTKEQLIALVGGSFRGMVHPKDLNRVEQEISKQIRQHMDLDYTEYRIVTAKGRVKKVRDYGRYVSRADGTGIFYVMLWECPKQ